MHVARIKSSHVDKAGRRRDYQSVYLRRTYRDGGKVRHEKLANLSALPEAAITAIEAVLAGPTLVAPPTAIAITRSLPHGHVAAVRGDGAPAGPARAAGPGRAGSRDLALALIISRVVAARLETVHPDLVGTTPPWARIWAWPARPPTRSTPRWTGWPTGRTRSRSKLAARHLAPSVNPSRMALFDLSSSWVTGRCCELAARGYSRDGKKGCEQIEYGLLTDPAGRPVAVRVFPGNTADPTAFTDDRHRRSATRFGLAQLVLVGDRGMITSARIAALRELNDAGTGFGWITALRAPAIATLAADDGPLQMSLFDAQDLAEITHPDYPGERLIACRNPALAAERARKRVELLAATDKLLAPHRRPGRRRHAWPGPARSAIAVGKVIGKYKMGKHFHTTITDTSFTVDRDQAAIDAEAALDGIYVLRTSVDRRRPRPRRSGRQPTRTSPTSNATSASSRPTTWTCAPSTTASTTASEPTC